MRFEKKVAIVTGAAQGIGFEICKELLKEGARVILNDIDATLAQKAIEELKEFKGDCLAFSGDAADVDFIQRMVNEAVDKFGKLDMAVANAGITLFGDFFDYPEKSFARVMQVNLNGSFFLAQTAAKQFRKQGNGGSILFMSSVTGHQAHRELAAYGMSKAALEMLAKSLVIDLSPFNININAIAPGATLTERTVSDPEYHNIWSKLTPMGRPGKPSDIAHAALFLLDEQSRHITGQSLVVDGGWSAVSPSPPA